ncbi:Aminopeptidase N [Blattella germanica]|nr:Aminopeptidase N [Blattella germanica]
MAVILLLMLVTGVLAVDYRLPETVTPSYYVIKLVSYFEERNFTFLGEVDITVTAAMDTDKVVLHYDDMEILETPVITCVDGIENFEVVGTDYDNETNFYSLELNDTLVMGQEYVIHIEFEGDLDQDMVGFYKSSYNNSNNETKWMAVTQFEPTDARKAFPCFDEPALKAKFQVNIARTPDYNSISNMPLFNSSEPDPDLDGRIWDSFYETPLMSTYLVAFVVSDLKNLTSEDGKYSVWLREQIISQGKFALSIAPGIIQEMENYTGIKYELPKLDQVAIPDLFYWAMENWGLVTLWEGHVTYKEGRSSEESKQGTLLVVAHEFAHLWFGDLVSPKWWDYLWLNEGFASYFEYKLSAKLAPEWNMEDQLLTDLFQSALYEDALNSTHPMTHVVGSPAEVNKIFDMISYDKGAAVIRSMEHFLTPETLQKGLRKYLTKYSHSVAEPNDLFEILNEQQKEDGILPDDMDVKTIMDSWTLQSGYPVIHVKRKNGGIQIMQERFMLKTQDNSINDTLWWVPITYTTSKDPQFTETKPETWLKAEPEMMLLDKIDDDEWIILNIQSTGFFRINYDPDTWKLLKNHMTMGNHRDINVLNRAQLLDDAFTLARVGMIDYTLALDITTYLQNETDPTPWKSFINKVLFITWQLHGTDIYASFKGYGLALIGHLYDSIGFRNDLNHTMKIIQPTVTHWACMLDHKDCVTKSIELFSDWMAKPEDSTIIPSDLKGVVYCTAARNNKKMWEFLWKQYKSKSDSEEEEEEEHNIYQALGCTEDEDLLKRYLNLSISEDMKDGDVESAVYYVLHSSPKGVEAALMFLEETLADIVNKTDDMDIIGGTISMIATHITMQEQADKLNQLLEDNDLTEKAEEENWIPETMEEDILWTKKHYDTIKKWLVDFLVNRTRR